MSDHLTKIKNLDQALKRLEEGIKSYNPEDLMHRDALIQRFEFSFELAWKTLKSLFESEGLIGLNSPKLVLKEAYAANLISDENVWLDMLKDRNLTTHIYNEEVANQICERILSHYARILRRLTGKLQQRIEG